jgi:protein involved in polysaccharide export with SLBB domain
VLPWIAGAAVLAFCAPVLQAQCSAGNNSDPYGCQLPLTASASSSAQAGQSSALPMMQQAPQQATQSADLSTNASAENNLFGQSSYTDPGLRNGPASAAQPVKQPFPPEPPTEFQRFVAATTGRMLPVYGAKLFAQQAASFGPIDQAPTPENMVVGTGDQLRIRIWGQVNFSANLQVSREGEIYLPKVGAVHVAGLEFSAVAGHLRQAIERVYRNFELSVDMGEIHSIQVYVAGEARQPGEYTVSALSTLVDAVFLSGGPARTGSMRHVELKRAGKVLTDFDLYALLVQGDKSGDVQLQSGDVLFIPPAGPEVTLMGSVRQSAIYELRGQESIGQLIATAGGLSAVASGGRVSVERIEDHAQRRAFSLKADEAGLATPLANGDIVRIDPIISDYRETVTLRGSVATPGRFRWHQGMRLSDLMPDRDSLVSRNYWWRRTQMGLPAPEFAPSLDSFAAPTEPGGSPDAVFSAHPEPLPSDDDPSAAMQKASASRSSGSAGTVGSVVVNQRLGRESALLRPAFETDWNYAVIERLDPSTMATSLIPFDLGKLVLDHDASQDLELQPSDIVTVFSQDEISQPIGQQTKYVRLEGEFAHPGVYSAQPGESLRSLAERAGGLTDKAYLYGAEFTRKSTQAIEEQRLKEYADRLEHQLARSSIAMASAGNGSTPQGGQPELAVSLNRELIGRLRQLQPTGRIVLELNPRSAGEKQLPEMSLENGDQLLVPPTPATIQVVGAVLNQNAFLYHEGARAGQYLHLAGGPNRDADRGQSFVLRADGSVTSHGAGQSIFSSGFENVRLYPGDTIVVPEKNIGPGALREFLSWSQLFSQVALGAAAIDVIK